MIKDIRMIDLSGTWTVTLKAKSGKQTGRICLPGSLQASGYGNPIDDETPWVSSLHDKDWQDREEYKYGQEEGVQVPFLAQPKRHFLGKASYERTFTIEKEKNDHWYLYIELTKWRSKAFVDGEAKGEDCSLCTAHKLSLGRLTKGLHTLRVEIDNSMQYPYRPDGHGVSDALGATWNGMVGEILLLTEEELQAGQAKRQAYAETHPRRIEAVSGDFVIDGHKEYMRGTHFGGEYPLTGYPETNPAWWEEKFRIIKSYGLNFVRCHSYCPPEAAFQAADEAGIYLQPECGMWNHFEEGIDMLSVLKRETERILEQFGHHPSFVLFSPTNEPSGSWYRVLRDWVKETADYDRKLGYAGRRLYTAQSGWFYDTEPAGTEGTDYLYFHRSAYGPFLGGSIRGEAGWKGGNYSPSLTGVSKPVICHELGQWCSYPSFDVAEAFTGFMTPSNYNVFKENAKAKGILPYQKDFTYSSGRNQVRLYKEDIEANLRTPEIKGFELLDIHDYLGQGTALVGVLDPFWRSKGYVEAKEFREFCSETVLLAAFPKYVYADGEEISVPVSICHYGRKDLEKSKVSWELCAYPEGKSEELVDKGSIDADVIPQGAVTAIGTVSLDRKKVWAYVEKHGNRHFHFRLSLPLDDKETDEAAACYDAEDIGICRNLSVNCWDLYCYCAKPLEYAKFGDDSVLYDSNRDLRTRVVYTRSFDEASEALEAGERVVYAPYLSELDYECPPLSMRNTFWNGQLGPTWTRGLGMVVDTDFKKAIETGFPTESTGGWQWEDILRHARGFHLKESLLKSRVLVRIIDDWNRNLPLGLILEGRVGAGKLLLVSADLGVDSKESFARRPAAGALRASLIAYAASEAFNPTEEIAMEDVKRNLFPTGRMEELCILKGQEQILVSANPNQSAVFTGDAYPIPITLPFKRQVLAKGLLYVPDQRERKRREYPKEVTIQVQETENGPYKDVCQAVFHNSNESQKIFFDKPCKIMGLRLLISSCFGALEDWDWQEERDGYFYRKVKIKPTARLAGIHIICDEASEEKREGNDLLFWAGETKSTTKEIEA